MKNNVDENAVFEEYKYLFEGGVVYLECDNGWLPIIKTLLDTVKNLNRTICVAEKKHFLYDFCERLSKLCSWVENKIPIFKNRLYKHLNNKTITLPGYRIIFTQIKEKFGILRVYYNIEKLYTKEDVKKISRKSLEKAQLKFEALVDGAILFAETMSASTCERCGDPGKLRPNRLIKCLCVNCVNSQL